MHKPILSICIPNYNRPEMLTKNLEAIAIEKPQKVEIVVVDDCSNQPVDQVIENFKRKYPKIKLRFIKNEHNLGFDKNVLKTINCAQGEYCWLLSNDDKILPGGITKILKIIVNDPKTSLISVNYQRYDHLAQKITAQKMIDGIDTQLFRDPNKFFFLPTPKGYFKSLGINTITMSTDIVKRNWWLSSAKNIEKYTKHNFIHVFVIVRMIQKHPHVHFVSEPQVEYLSNNHRIWPNDIWKDYNRFLLNYLIKLGYNRTQVKSLREKLKENETRESLAKNKYLSGLYHIILLTLGKYRQLKNSLFQK